MSERWRVAEEWRCNPFTGAPERFVIRSSADDATVICVEGPNCDEDAHRVAAAMNAMEGIPTETLEAGVVVVPVEVATAALPLIERQREWAFQFAAEYQQMLCDEDVDSKALVQRRETKIAEAWAWDALAVALSRFQQNGGARR